MGHGGHANELVSRPVDALAGKKVIGAAAAVITQQYATEDGEIFTFGWGHDGQLGHGGQDDEPVPRLSDAGGEEGRRCFAGLKGPTLQSQTIRDAFARMILTGW